MNVAKKIQQYLPIIILLFLICSLIYMRFFDSDQTNLIAYTSNANQPIVNILPTTNLLSTDTLAQANIDFEDSIPAEKIINQNFGYKKEYEELLTLMENIKNDKNWPFFGEEGYYLSTKTIRQFNAVENKVLTQELMYVFSKDLSKAVCVQLNKEVTNILFSLSYSPDDKLLALLQANPDKKFICLTNGLNSLVIDPENTLYLSSGNDITVEGDYYRALNPEAMSFSFNEILDSLVWVDW